jgi:hypothetical protein
MALRKNPQRSCQEGTLPLNDAYKYESAITEIRDTSYNRSERQPLSQRGTKRKATDTQRQKSKRSSQQPHRPTSDKPFPFFELPREIRDQVYSSLVTRPNNGRSIIAAVPILSSRKKRVAARSKRERTNRTRIMDGKPPLRIRETNPEPVVHLKFLQASHRLHQEAKDCLYSTNWFAITLDRLPHTTFETPYGWALSRITRLQVELQLKDAAHMNSYVDWTALFSSFTSLRFLHVVFTFHPRYYDWAYSQLCDWTTTQYVHKAFFRELLAAIPSHIDVKFGVPNSTIDLSSQGKVINDVLVRDMYAELGTKRILQTRQSATHGAGSWR